MKNRIMIAILPIVTATGIAAAHEYTFHPLTPEQRISVVKQIYSTVTCEYANDTLQRFDSWVRDEEPWALTAEEYFFAAYLSVWLEGYKLGAEASGIGENYFSRCRENPKQYFMPDVAGPLQPIEIHPHDEGHTMHQELVRAPELMMAANSFVTHFECTHYLQGLEDEAVGTLGQDYLDDATNKLDQFWFATALVAGFSVASARDQKNITDEIIAGCKMNTDASFSEIFAELLHSQ